MADYRVVNAEQLDADLTTIADAIRAQTGGTESLVFPEGMVEALQNIQADNSDMDAILSGLHEGDYVNDRITNVRYYAFAHCNGPKTIRLPAVTRVRSYAFNSNSGLTAVELPALSDLEGGVFTNCAALQYVDMGMAYSLGWSATFNNCTSLKTLVLRRASVSGLANVNFFSGTPFASGGSGGKVYVPSALIESYKAATNWSVLYGYGTCEFVALEGSEYE